MNNSCITKGVVQPLTILNFTAMKCDGSDAKTKKKGKEVIAMTCGGSEPRSKKKNEGVYQLTV